MITILYFGMLKHHLQTNQEQLAWEGGTGEQLLILLQACGEEWANVLKPEKVFLALALARAYPSTQGHSVP